ncbi:hypothetical protein BH11ARM2_BH11ARM2_19710 [soil metagenome]
MLSVLTLAILGQQVGGKQLPTAQTIEPYGSIVDLKTRPVALVVSEGSVYVKDNEGVRLVNPNGSALARRLPGGSSLTGLLARGRSLYTTDAASGLVELSLPDLKIQRTITLPKPKVGGAAYGCGIAEVANRLYVCGSRGNELIEVDPASGKVGRRLDLPPSPFAVAAYGPAKLAVTCWGRRPGKRHAPSSGTEVDVDSRGISTGGTLVIVNLKPWRVEREIPVGAQPAEMAMLPDGRLAVACANADDLEVLLPGGKVRKTVLRANPSDAFGSAPNGMVYDAGRLYVTLGGANAIAVIDLAKGEERPVGLVPTGWYPGPVAKSSIGLVVGNIKGQAGARSVYEFHGSLQRFPFPDLKELASLTATAMRLARAPREIPVKTGIAARPIPAHLGDPSVIKHIVYVIRENRTYDQILGDMKEGDGDPKFCMFGEKVTPNGHALARNFVLLDNYYCNGVNSADGHAWTIEGNASNYFERSFGGWTRSYPFGDDPLSTTTTGFLWDHVLAGGRTFRNHGEYDDASTWNPKTTFQQLLAGEGRRFKQHIGVERLRRYSSNVPGWNLGIPDQVRADRFLAEFHEAETSGVWPDMNILYLPQDHTAGTGPGGPTPRAMVADNDLALGRVIEAISKSRFWPSTAVFVIEDDPQAGFDHVDGHRSVCLIASPYTRGRGRDSHFYNQTSVLRTMFRILGLPLRTRFEAASPLFSPAFRAKADLTPYSAIPNEIPLTEVNPSRTSLKGAARRYADASMHLPLSQPDQVNDDLFNRILWENRRPGVPYPSRYAEAHGRGLRQKGLVLDRENDD